MSRTAVVILNYNNCTDTANCLRSLREHNSAPVRVIVVDNASDHDERQALIDTVPKVYPEATLILGSENVGYARGNNLGLDVAYADPDIDRVLILNNDIIWTDDILPRLIERLDTLPDCGVISPLLYKADRQSLDINCARRNPTVGQMISKNILHYWWRLRGISDRDAQPDLYLLKEDYKDALKEEKAFPILEVELPSGSCMLIKKDLMREIGGFDPYTFLYYEENILFKKLSAKGLRNYVCTDLSCVHLGAATTSALPSSLFVMRQSIRSAKHYLRTYSGASLIQRLAYSASATFLIATFRLQKLLKHK